MTATLYSIVLSLFLAGCSVVGVRSGYEQPPYQVVERPSENVELRQYASRVAAEANVTAGNYDQGRSAAFRPLFRYITGENNTDASIDMTTPVEAEQISAEIAMTAPVETAATGDGGIRMRFFLPDEYSVETAPAPLDPRIQIVPVPEQTMAVLRFSGRGNETAVTSRTQELIEVLESTNWRPISPPIAYFYDPPWTLPPLRRNEIAVRVEQVE